jgi:hypothetical protein
MAVLNTEVRKSEIVRTSTFSESKTKQKQYQRFLLPPALSYLIIILGCMMMDHDGLALLADIDITQLKLAINRQARLILKLSRIIMIWYDMI